LDLTSLVSEYSEEGRPAYHPEIILSLLFCAYSDGITSARVIAHKTRTDVVYMYLAGMLEPDFRTIADFRKDHLRQIKEYFRKIVEIAMIAGVSSFAQISIDGSKIKANASKKCLKTEEKLDELIKDVERQIAAHLEKAVQTDEEEDKKYGEYADETSQELAEIGQENFKKYIKEAKERLEKLDQAKKELGRRKGLMKAEHRENHQVNLTDVEAVLMDTPQGFVVGYNGQIAVDNDSKLIGAWGLSQERNDRKQLRPMVEETIEITTKVPVEAMRTKMQKQESQKDYYQRQTSVEPVFGNLKFNLGFDRFRMRGLEKVKIEFGLMCIAHNLNRLFKITIATQNQRLMRYMRTQGI
jgi:transposase